MYSSTHLILYFLVLWSEADACIAMKSSKDDGMNIWPTDPTTGLPVAPTSASTLNEMTTTPVTTESTTTTDSTTSTTTTTTTTTTVAPLPQLALNCPTNVAIETEPIPANACDPGWTAFRRVKGVVCLKAFTDSQNDAGSRAACEAQNAVLSGIENSNERNWIHEQFVSLVAGTMNIIFIYIGATKIPGCNNSNPPPNCYPLTTESFYWSDNTVTGTDGFCPWWKDQPDGGIGQNVLQPAVQFSIMDFPGPYGPYDAVQGGLDDVVGDKPLQGYVCSKPST